MNLSDNDIARLERLSQLKEKNVLSEEEFLEQKNAILYPKERKQSTIIHRKEKEHPSKSSETIPEVESKQSNFINDDFKHQKDVRFEEKDKYEMKLNDMIPIVTCQNCGNEISGQAKDCPICGVHQNFNYGKDRVESKDNNILYKRINEPNIRFSMGSIDEIFWLFVVLYWFSYFMAFYIHSSPQYENMILGLFLLWVFPWAILFYRHWQLLQGYSARTTPIKAIGYFFIPIFNIYWFFFVIPALAKDNNSYMNQENIVGPQMSYGISIYVVLSRLFDFLTFIIVVIRYGRITYTKVRNFAP